MKLMTKEKAVISMLCLLLASMGQARMMDLDPPKRKSGTAAAAATPTDKPKENGVGSTEETEKAKWRKQFEAARSARAALWGFGVGGLVAGTGLIIAGDGDISDAESTPGCSYDGSFTITCRDGASQSQAQSKLDSGETKQVAGLVVLLVGGALSYWGYTKGNEIDALQRRGKRQGWAWKLGWEEEGRATLLALYRY